MEHTRIRRGFKYLRENVSNLLNVCCKLGIDAQLWRLMYFLLGVRTSLCDLTHGWHYSYHIYAYVNVHILPDLTFWDDRPKLNFVQVVIENTYGQLLIYICTYVHTHEKESS
jgi:hypothetical protein